MVRSAVVCVREGWKRCELLLCVCEIKALLIHIVERQSKLHEVPEGFDSSSDAQKSKIKCTRDEKTNLFAILCLDSSSQDEARGQKCEGIMEWTLQNMMVATRILLSKGKYSSCSCECEAIGESMHGFPFHRTLQEP